MQLSCDLRFEVSSLGAAVSAEAAAMGTLLTNFHSTSQAAATWSFPQGWLPPGQMAQKRAGDAEATTFPRP